MNRKNIYQTAMFVAALTFAGSQAFASTTTPIISTEEYSVGQGDITIDFDFSPNLYFGDSDGHEIDLTLGANYFLTDVFAPGLLFRVVDIDAFGTAVQFLPNLKAYYPLNQRLLPFAQFGLGYAHVYGGADLFAFALGAGVDYLLSNTVAIGFQFKYDLGVGDGTHHRLSFPLGFALYFKL